MWLSKFIFSFLLFNDITQCQEEQDIKFITDPLHYGPPLEVVHAYYGQWPTGEPLVLTD